MAHFSMSAMSPDFTVARTVNSGCAGDRLTGDPDPGVSAELPKVRQSQGSKSSSQIFGRLGALTVQPLDQLRGAASVRRIDWRQPVVSDPVEVCAAPEEIFRRAALSAVAGTPERICHLVWRGRRVTREMLRDACHQPSRSGPPGCGSRTAL